MSGQRSLFIGPRLRRFRRDLGKTQVVMAGELGISPSYVALIERNQRPVSAEVLVRLAEVYGLDVASFASEGPGALAGRLSEVLRDPLFEGIDVAPNEAADAAASHPGVVEALIRQYTAYQEGQLALAERGAGEPVDAPLEEVRAFLAARRNYFPVLDERAERLALDCDAAGGMVPFLKERHGLGFRRLPPDVMHGATRRLDYHRAELALSDTLDHATEKFQLALQLAYLELSDQIDAAMLEGNLSTDNARRIARRALGNYVAGAMLMPYGAFFAAAEARHYDVHALSRLFACSFEQTAHRLTTLQRKGATGVPFFFIRVDAAGNVSKRLDGGDAPFARHGGSCPIWSLHHAFRRPREILTEVLELPDGEKYFSIVRTVTAGEWGYGVRPVERAIALGCPLGEAYRLIYARDLDLKAGPSTPIGISCRLCHRADCTARAEPPIGRQLLMDDHRRLVAPFGFSDQ